MATFGPDDIPGMLAAWNDGNNTALDRLELRTAGAIQCENRTHFLAVCAQMIRRILVDHARRRGSARRGGNALDVPLDEVLLEVETCGVDVTALHSARQSLAELDARKSRLVGLLSSSEFRSGDAANCSLM